MLTKFSLTGVILTIGLLSQGCGKDSGGGAAPAPEAQKTDATTQPVPYSMALATAADLPACDEAHDKQLVYLLDEKQFQTCQAGKWEVVEIPAPAPTRDLAAEGKAALNAALTVTAGSAWTAVPDSLKKLFETDGEVARPLCSGGPKDGKGFRAKLVAFGPDEVSITLEVLDDVIVTASVYKKSEQLHYKADPVAPCQ